jgi:predicted metal-dependent phosphotriesterase family hydrolase
MAKSRLDAFEDTTAAGDWAPTRVPKNTLPALKRAGAEKAKIRAIPVENPRRYFQN